MELDLSNVMNVSVSQAPSGLGPFNVNNLALFTDEVPGIGFPVAGYQIYKGARQVGQDFGTGSKTFAMASAIFSQSPNLLAGGGSLIIFRMLTGLSAATQIQNVSLSAVPTVGVFRLSYLGNETADIPYNANAAAVQSALQAITGLATVTVTGSAAAGYVITMTGVTGDVPPFAVTVSTLKDTNGLNVTVTPSVTTHYVAAGATEQLLAAIVRTQVLLSYCGVIKTNAYVPYELMNAANYVQSQNLLLFAASNLAGDVTVTTGIFWQVMNAGNSKTRCLLYLKDTYDSANVMAAAYAGRALSTDFSGSNTTQTMHLKDLANVVADPNMTQAIYNAALIAGADVYASFMGVPKVATSGANRFFDQVYNQMWLTTALQVSAFNAIAQTGTKVPQTEQGMGTVKTASRLVTEQARKNGYAAPGSWTADTFGDQQDFLRNINERGYYLYSAPITQQLQADRAARKAPLIQIAVKEAGAIHSGNVLVNINA